MFQTKRIFQGILGVKSVRPSRFITLSSYHSSDWLKTRRRTIISLILSLVLTVSCSTQRGIVHSSLDASTIRMNNKTTNLNNQHDMNQEWNVADWRLRAVPNKKKSPDRRIADRKKCRSAIRFHSSQKKRIEKFGSPLFDGGACF